MNPTPIPDDEIFEDHRRVVIGPPAGHDPTGDIRSIEALIADTPGMGKCFRTRWVPDAREIERLAAGEPIWVTQWAPQMVVFDVAMTEEA
ncbi:MAG: hypothetical protein JWN67_5013 [Actinomycetia bacterium]|nr:hypothetical protein [Actinomycetes bacterium]